MCFGNQRSRGAEKKKGMPPNTLSSFLSCVGEMNGGYEAEKRSNKRNRRKDDPQIFSRALCLNVCQ